MDNDQRENVVLTMLEKYLPALSPCPIALPKKLGEITVVIATGIKKTQDTNKSHETRSGLANKFKITGKV